MKAPQCCLLPTDRLWGDSKHGQTAIGGQTYKSIPGKSWELGERRLVIAVWRGLINLLPGFLVTGWDGHLLSAWPVEMLRSAVRLWLA